MWKKLTLKKSIKQNFANLNRNVAKKFLVNNNFKWKLNFKKKNYDLFIEGDQPGPKNFGRFVCIAECMGKKTKIVS